jgi:hypothetical protein
MRFATSPRLLHIGREDREAKLKEFIGEDLAARRAAGSSAHCYTLLARAPDSPVARALGMLATELADANVSVQAVLLDLDSFTDEPGRASVLDLVNADVRLLTDVRFTAAHEQMVLSVNRLWLGDCMRRDPAKRDAFEIFHDVNAAAAQHACVSFARLWASAQPIRRVRPLAPELVLAGQIAEDAAGAPLTRR